MFLPTNSVDRKIRDTKLVEKVLAIAEKDVNLAFKVVKNLEDREARIMGYIYLYNFTCDEAFLELAINEAETDDDLLRIVEYSKSKKLSTVAMRIKDQYKRDVAYSILLERSGDLNLAGKIVDRRLQAASLKRLALKKPYPESLSVARMISDPYYRTLALIEIAGNAEREGVDLGREILESCRLISNPYLRKRVEKRWEQSSKKY